MILIVPENLPEFAAKPTTRSKTSEQAGSNNLLDCSVAIQRLVVSKATTSAKVLPPSTKGQIENEQKPSEVDPKNHAKIVRPKEGNENKSETEQKEIVQASSTNDSKPATRMTRTAAKLLADKSKATGSIPEELKPTKTKRPTKRVAQSPENKPEEDATKVEKKTRARKAADKKEEDKSVIPPKVLEELIVKNESKADNATAGKKSPRRGRSNVRGQTSKTSQKVDESRNPRSSRTRSQLKNSALAGASHDIKVKELPVSAEPRHEPSPKKLKSSSKKDNIAKVEANEPFKSTRTTRKTIKDKAAELSKAVSVDKQSYPELVLKRVDAKSAKPIDTQGPSEQTKSSSVVSTSTSGTAGKAVSEDQQSYPKLVLKRVNAKSSVSLLAQAPSKQASAVSSSSTSGMSKPVSDDYQSFPRLVMKRVDAKCSEQNVSRESEQSKSPSKTAAPADGAPAKANDVLESNDDPYSFEMSQVELGAKKVKNKPKKRNAKPKPGNKMDLLMQQKTLDVVGYSCNVQQNPSRYEKERENLEKQINVPMPAITKVVVDEGPSEVQANISPLVKEQHVGPSTSRKVYSKVWHSPPAPPAPTRSEHLAEHCVSDSPPIQSAFALQLAKASRSSASVSTPFRVTGNLPSAFYMGLSRNDGTPTYSSDLIENEKRSAIGNNSRTEKSIDVPIDNSQSSESKNQSSPAMPSFMADSNAENMEPPGFVKTPKKKTKTRENRSPLKALAQSTFLNNEVSFKSPVKEATADESKLAEETSESLDLGAICEQAGSSSPLDCEESETRDEFGFDELVEQDRQTAQPSTVNVASSSDDTTKRMNALKRFLPSKNNKDRDKYVFPTSPMKKLNMMKSPSKAETTSIRKYFASSTPLPSTSKAVDAQFKDTSNVEVSSVADGDTECDYSNLELFGDNSELPTVNCQKLFNERDRLNNFSFFQTRRNYARQKQMPKFLSRIEESESEADEDATKKSPAKPKRKKFNIEEVSL